MLLRAPLRNYLSLIWPQIAQKHGINQSTSIPKRPPPPSRISPPSQVVLRAEQLSWAYDVAQDSCKEPLHKALGPFIEKFDSVFKAEDLLSLGLLLYRAENGVHAFPSPEASSLLQYQLYQLLANKTFNNAELCLILLIFKRMALPLDFYGLREALYQSLITCVKAPHFDPISSFTIISLVVSLNKDQYLIARDDPRLIREVHSSANFTNLPIKAALKVLSLGVRSLPQVLSRQRREVEVTLFSRLESGEIKDLSLRELSGGLLYYCHKRSISLGEKDTGIVSHIRTFLPRVSLYKDRDVLDYVQSYVFLSDMGIYDEELYERLTNIINGVESSKHICKKVYSALCCSSSGVFNADAESPRLIHLLLYIIMSYRFANPSLCPRPETDKLLWLSSQLKRYPPSNAIECKLHRELLNTYLSNEQVCFSHLLPHFKSPCLLFGHLAGNPLSVPDYLLSDSGSVKPAPELGSWSVVIGLESPDGVNEDGISDLDEILSSRDSIRRRQLEFLGYKVIVVTSRDLILHGNRIAEKIIRWSFDT